MVTGSGEIAVWTETALAQETHLGDRKLRVFFFLRSTFWTPFAYIHLGLPRGTNSVALAARGST